MIGTGTTLNALGIIAGGIAGMVRKAPLTAATESFWKVLLGAFTVYYGLRLTWSSLNGGPTQILKQLLLVVIALSLGRWTGWLLHLQQFSNRMGQAARARINVAATTPTGLSDAFQICSALFCAAPLGILGAIQDGISGNFYPLAVKAVIDGLGAMGLARVLGWGVSLSAMPVLILQGTLTLASAAWLEPFLRQHGLLNAFNATAGLLIFCVALVILQLKKIPLTDYLPSLFYAPLLAAVWR